MNQPFPTKLVQNFQERVTWIRGLDRIMDELFQNPVAQGIMDKTAPQFMMKMNMIVLNSILGAMCRITEPAKSHGQQNLTIRTIVKRILWTDGRAPQAEQIAQRCDCFHRLLKEGRNKLLAHNDLKTALDDKRFPLPPRIAKDVIEQLECLIKLAYEQDGRPWSSVVLMGDERCFIRALNDSLLYERALDDPRLSGELRSEMLLWRLEAAERHTDSLRR